MPRYRDNGLGTARRHREAAALPLPGPALVIDVSHGNDLRLIQFLATELEDLAREMRLHQVYQWRHLAECIEFLKLDAIPAYVTLDPTSDFRATFRGHQSKPDTFSGFEVTTPDGKKEYFEGIYELVMRICKNYLNGVRNSRIKAIADNEEDVTEGNFKAASPEHSSVRVFFLADLKEEESFTRAATYAAWLKEWYVQDAGPTRPGHDERIETVTICMNAAPHRHAYLLTKADLLSGLDKVILLQTYRDDDGYIDEETQVYQAELMLYTLLLHWPESLERGFDDAVIDPLDGIQHLLRPTYLIGISALEYSARWGARWLDYGLAAKIIELLRDTREVQNQEKQVQFEVEAWWRDWWQRLQAIVPDALTGILSSLQALDQLQRLTAAADFRHSSPQTLLQSLAVFRQQVGQLYTGTDRFTLQHALDNAAFIPAQLKQHHERALADEDESSPANDLYHRLSALQTEAQLFFLPLYQGARGAVPRALRQIFALSRNIKALQQIEQHPPDLQECHEEFARQAAEALTTLEDLLQANRVRKKELQREQELAYYKLSTTIQKHLAQVRQIIAANVALIFLQSAELYDPAGAVSPYQQRLQRLDHELDVAQQRALYQQELANERLKFSLSETQTHTAGKAARQQLNNRKDMLKWNTVTASFLRSYNELQPNSELLSEMLVRRMAAQKSLLNGQNHRSEQSTGFHSPQDRDEAYFHAKSTALATALLSTKVSDIDLIDILPLLNQYAQMKQRYLLEPSVLDSDVLDVGHVVKEAMLEQIIHGSKNTNLAQKRGLSTEFMLAAWIGSQHGTDLALAEALDSRSMVAYLGDHKNLASQMIRELGKQNKLDGYPDRGAGDDHFYLFLPPGDTSEAFLKALDYAQATEIHPVRFPDIEKLIYLHIHRIRQI